MQRLKDNAATKGYHVTQMVGELASGLNESRPKFLKLLADVSIGTIVVEHRDRATRFGLYRATGKRPNTIALHKKLNALKPSQFPWMYEISKCAPQEALR